MIEKKSREMAQMVSQLLFLSRADQGKQQLQKENLNISELTQMIAEEQQMIAQEKHIVIETEISQDIYAWIDESLYIRMLINLMANAIYYNKEPGWIKVSLKEEQDGVKGSVEDHGIGISQELCLISGSVFTERIPPEEIQSVPVWGFLWFSGLSPPTKAIFRHRANREKEAALRSGFRKNKKICVFNLPLMFLYYTKNIQNRKEQEESYT